jgi:hypothetical protein
VQVIFACGAGNFMADQSSLASILRNLRDAAVDFSKPYQTPGTIPAALRNLLAQLGIADPGDAVRAQLENAVKNWGNLGKELSNLDLNFVDPVKTVAEITEKGDKIKANIEGILKTPEAIWSTLGAAGAAIKAVFPKRLLDFIVYEFLTKSHPKIGGAFLLFAVLRREPTAPPSAAFVFANIRVFDLAQLIKVVTHPRQAILEALKWGTDQFNARPLVDGIALLGGLIGGTPGPEEDTFDLAEERKYVPDLALMGGLEKSARRTLSAGPAVLQFVGLHHAGLGVLVTNPVNLSGGVGSLHPPVLPPGIILALSPGADRLNDPPVVKRLP